MRIAAVSATVTVAILTVGVPFGATAEPTPAPINVDRVVSVDEVALNSLQIGASRIFVYVNPFEHAGWTGKIDGTIVAGPSSVYANAGNLPTPLPEPSGNTLNIGTQQPPLVPKYNLQTIGGATSASACDATLDNQHAIEDCRQQADGELSAVVAKVGAQGDFPSKTPQEFGTYQIAMNQVASAVSAFTASPIAPPNGNDIAPYLRKAAKLVAKARTERSNIAAIPDWPKSEIAAVTGHYALLAQVLQSCDDCWFRTDAKAPKNQVPSKAAQQTLIASRNTALTDVIAAKNKAAKIATYETGYTAEKTALLDAAKFLANLTVSQFGFVAESNCNGLFSGGREKTVTITFVGGQTVALKLVCVSRMFTSYGVAFSSSGTHNYTANAMPSTPAPTPASTQTSAPTPPTLTTVADNGPGKYRPIFVTMAHFALGEHSNLQQDAFQHAFYGTVGVGASTTTSSQNPFDFDFLYGLSYAVYRSAVLTFGQHYGKEQQLAPGYFIGQQLTTTANTPIPTVSLYHFRPFFSITLGKQ